MAYKKRYRKTYRRKRRMFKKRSYKRYKPIKNNINQIFVKRQVQLSGQTGYPYSDLILASGTISETYKGDTYVFKVTDVKNYAEYAALYKEYKICGIKFKIEYMSGTEYFTSGPTSGVQDRSGIMMMIWFDPTDNIAPASTVGGWNQAFESGKKIIHFPNVKKNYKTLYFRPSINVDADGGGATYATNLKPQWLLFQSPNVNHFSVKVALNAQPSSLAVIHYFRIYATYYLKFRGAAGS